MHKPKLYYTHVYTYKSTNLRGKKSFKIKTCYDTQQQMFNLPTYRISVTFGRKILISQYLGLCMDAHVKSK